MKRMVLACLFLSACGSDAKHTGGDTPADPNSPDNPSGAESAKQFSLFLDSKADLPTCGETNQRQLVYVADETKFYACKETEWVEISIKGEAGTSNKITKSIGCFGTLEGTSINVNYRASLLSSGDIFAQAMVTHPAEYLQASTAIFYSKDQVGAATASVPIVFDIQGGNTYGNWDISLNRETLVVTAEYKDSDMAGGGQSWSMTPDKCVVNSYDE